MTVFLNYHHNFQWNLDTAGKVTYIFVMCSLLRVLIAIWCVGILMQFLGTPTTLWDLQAGTDPVTASVLEGLSLPPTPPTLSEPVGYARLDESTESFRPVVLPHFLFRPPSLAS